uniref:Uncharacterized protein n=1 Tax=Leersia perrieri TaxID=77586 RepID=A0A0D9WER4_9ORYZ
MAPKSISRRAKSLLKYLLAPVVSPAPSPSLNPRPSNKPFHCLCPPPSPTPDSSAASLRRVREPQGRENVLCPAPGRTAGYSYVAVRHAAPQRPSVGNAEDEQHPSRRKELPEASFLISFGLGMVLERVQSTGLVLSAAYMT